MALNARRAADGGWQNKLLVDTGTKLLDISGDVGSFSLNSNANVIQYEVQGRVASLRTSAGGVVEVGLDTFYYGDNSREFEDLSKSTSADPWLCILSGKGDVVGHSNGTRVYVLRAVMGAQELSAVAGDLMTATATFQQADVPYGGDKYTAFTTRPTANLSLPDYDSVGFGKDREEVFLVITSYTPASTSPVAPTFTVSDGTNSSAAVTVNRTGIFHFAQDGTAAEPNGGSIVLVPGNASAANATIEGFVTIVKEQEFA